GITQVAPESLEPETIWTGEVEHTHEIDARSYVIASVFGSQIRDLISLGVNEDGLLEYENSGDDILSIGGELELRLTARSGAFGGLAVSYARLSTDAMAEPPDESPIEEVNSAAAAGAIRGFWPALAERLGLVCAGGSGVSAAVDPAGAAHRARADHLSDRLITVSDP